MSVYNSVYNPAGYLTDSYGPPVDQYVLHHWNPDPNQTFYTPSISQGIPPDWHCPPAFPINGNYSHMYPREFTTATPNPAYLPPTHYYMYPVPAAVPAPPEHPDNYSLL
ncbi:hypothetical protein H2248_010412 [Termitomyces sp. 'cryptogamus']|nr:hypothetical protein H2248_010412 [Termitomyces sp. 'cryptogamus']